MLNFFGNPYYFREYTYHKNRCFNFAIPWAVNGTGNVNAVNMNNTANLCAQQMAAKPVRARSSCRSLVKKRCNAWAGILEFLGGKHVWIILRQLAL